VAADPAPDPVKPPAIPVTGCEAVRAEAAKYPGWDAGLITAIAEAESHCRAEARGDGHLTYIVAGREYGYSVSALQVRILEGREHCDAYDISVNVKCAYAIWRGQGYEAWSVYNNGRYKQFL
jgi:hypothetical protein